MTHEAESHVRSVIVGDLKLPPEGTAGAEAAEVDPDEKVPMLIELNLRYPGGLATVRQDFYQLWADFVHRAGGSWPTEPASAGPVEPAVPPRLALIAPYTLTSVTTFYTRHGDWFPIVCAIIALLGLLLRAYRSGWLFQNPAPAQPTSE